MRLASGFGAQRHVILRGRVRVVCYLNVVGLCSLVCDPGKLVIRRWVLTVAPAALSF